MTVQDVVSLLHALYLPIGISAVVSMALKIVGRIM